MKSLRTLIAAEAAVLLSLSSVTALAFYQEVDPKVVIANQSIDGDGRFLVAQAAAVDPVSAARADLAVAEEALRSAKAGNGNIEEARRAVRRAQRALAKSIAAPATSSETTKKDAPTAQPATDQPPTAVQRTGKKRKQENIPSPVPEPAKEEVQVPRKSEDGEERAAIAAPVPGAPTGIQGETVDPKVERLRRKLAIERAKVRDLEARQTSKPVGPMVRSPDNRTIIQLQGQIIIRSNSETDRILRGADDIQVIGLPGGRTRTSVTRPNGTMIITIRDLNDEIIYRVRQHPNGLEVVLIDNRLLYEGQRIRRRVAIDLPPVVHNISRPEYVVEMGSHVSEQKLRLALMSPPVERVERAYSLEEIRYSRRLREMLRRIDISVTFDTGSAAISHVEAMPLGRLADAMMAILNANPDTVFLIEGHTDAIGSQTINLALSDRRAESVAIALSEIFDIPAENLITQGYGEAHLKIATLEAERTNRRVAVRNITGLLQGVSRR